MDGKINTVRSQQPKLAVDAKINTMPIQYPRFPSNNQLAVDGKINTMRSQNKCQEMWPANQNINKS